MYKTGKDNAKEYADVLSNVAYFRSQIWGEQETFLAKATY
jgi:hypothetical protein